MSSLDIKVSEKGEATLVELQGQINEDSEMSDLKSLKGNKLILNLKNINHINSCGIREWIEFQKEHFHFQEIEYEECPQVIIEQMNIVAGFIHSNGKITSFYAPYYSETEDKEYKILLKPSEVLDGKAPEKKDDSGNILEFDEIEAQYFNFLKK